VTIFFVISVKVADGMNRILIIAIFLAVPSLVTAQKFGREQIVGAWTTREVSVTQPSGQTPVENATVEKTKRGLVNSRFIFKPNGLFVLQLPINAPTEFRELESMNNKMWHIRSKERMVFVGSLDDDLMTINVKIVNGSYYFLIRDTPLVLRMERSR